MAKSPGSIEEYLQPLSETSRAILIVIRQMIAQASPEAIEGIKCGMPTATLHGTNIIYYAAWKRHIGLYPIYPGPPPFECRVGPYRDMKDTVRFPLDTEIPFDIIEFILTTRISHLNRKLDHTRG